MCMVRSRENENEKAVKRKIKKKNINSYKQNAISRMKKKITRISSIQK